MMTWGLGVYGGWNTFESDGYVHSFDHELWVLNAQKSLTLGKHSKHSIINADSISCCCCSVTKSCSTLRPHGLQQTRLPCPSLSPGACSNSCPLSRWCHSTISSSVVPFFSCPQSFPASGSFPVSRLVASGDWNIEASSSALVHLINIQGWFSLVLTSLVSLQSQGDSQDSQGLSRLFSSTTVCKHQFFGAQLSLWPNYRIHTWLMAKA